MRQLLKACGLEEAPQYLIRDRPLSTLNVSFGIYVSSRHCRRLVAKMTVFDRVEIDDVVR